MVYSYSAPPNPTTRAKTAPSSKNARPKPLRQADKPKRKNKQRVTLTVSCSHCDTPFKAKRNTAKYCTSSCRINAHRQAKRDTKLGNGKQCLKCCKPLTGRQRKFCSNSCSVLTHRAKKRTAIDVYQTIGMPLDTILESFERVGFTTASKALMTMGYSYSYQAKQWIG